MLMWKIILKIKKYYINILFFKKYDFEVYNINIIILLYTINQEETKSVWGRMGQNLITD
jgi:hypothetical protein